MIAWAEETKPTQDFPEKFMIRGGYNYIFNADTLFTVNGARGIGASVDFNKNLGGQREDSLWRIDSLYRFNPRHSIGFSYYDVTRSGVRSVDRDIEIGDRTFAAGGTLRSQLDIGLYRVFYNYSFHHDEKVELAASFGLYFADIGFSFNSSLTCTGGTLCTPGTTITPGGAASNFIVPLPSLGLLANYHITPRLMSQVRFDWFYIELPQFKGAMTEMYLGLEYRLFKHFALGTAFNRLDIDAKINSKKGGGLSINNDWNTLYIYGALYF